MRAERAKRLLKNGLYRTIGEATAVVAPPNGEADALLRVLMYHKINDAADAPLTVPVSLFDEQMGMLRELGYTVVHLDAVLDHFRNGAELPNRPVLITFDDGYRDNLDNAAPVLARHGYRAVVFVPIGYLDGAGPLPHDEVLARRGAHAPTLDWGALGELEAAGLRVESHGITHRALTELDEAAARREIIESKARLEERLGRRVQAFAYVKGSAADFRPVHMQLLRDAGYELAFTSLSGLNSPATNPLRLHRYNVEPYAARTFELVLSGACDFIGLKDTVVGTYARRVLNAALGTSTK